VSGGRYRSVDQRAEAHTDFSVKEVFGISVTPGALQFF
jgi:hypothetical protein